MFPLWRQQLLYPIIPGLKDLDEKIGPIFKPQLLDTVSNIHSEYLSSLSVDPLVSKSGYINKLEMNIMFSNTISDSELNVLYDQKISLLENFFGINERDIVEY